MGELGSITIPFCDTDDDHTAWFFDIYCHNKILENKALIFSSDHIYKTFLSSEDKGHNLQNDTFSYICASHKPMPGYISSSYTNLSTQQITHSWTGITTAWNISCTVLQHITLNSIATVLFQPQKIHFSDFSFHRGKNSSQVWGSCHNCLNGTPIHKNIHATDNSSKLH